MNVCTQSAPGCTGCPSFNVPHEPCSSSAAKAAPADFQTTALAPLTGPLSSFGPEGDKVRATAKAARRLEGLMSMRIVVRGKV